MKTSVLLAAAAAIVQPVLATLAVTQPVASTSANGGQRLNIAWQDDGRLPKVNGREWGRISIWLATGSTNTQYKLAQLAENLSPSMTSASAMIPANVGPNGKSYFLRFEGSRTDNKTGYPVMAFSARFQLSGMTGSFNSTIQATNSGADAKDPTTGTTGTTGIGAAVVGASNSSSSSSSPSMTTTTRPLTSATAAAPAAAGTTIRPGSSGAMANVQVTLAALAGAGVAALGAVVLL